MLIVPLVVVPLHGEHGEDQDKHAEDEALNEPDEELEAVERKRDERNGDGGHHRECEFAAVDVAEESHRERHWLNDLQEELEDADEEAYRPTLQREELAEIAAESERTEALIVEVDESNQRKPDGDVDITCWSAELVHSPNARDQAGPV